MGSNVGEMAAILECGTQFGASSCVTYPILSMIRVQASTWLFLHMSLHPAKQSCWDSALDPGFGCSHFLLVMGNPSLRVKIKNGEKIQILYLYPHWRGPRSAQSAQSTRAYLLISTERINLTYNTFGGARAPFESPFDLAANPH